MLLAPRAFRVLQVQLVFKAQLALMVLPVLLEPLALTVLLVLKE